MTNEELHKREHELSSTIESKIPDFALKCSGLPKAEVLILHQDAFAADYQPDELLLLGMAIKYAGIHGKVVHFIGTNRETLSTDTGNESS